MPESAEVRLIVDQLNQSFQHQSVLNIEIVGGRFLKEGISNLNAINYPLDNCVFHAKGKFIYATFDQNVNLFITLGMSGSFSSSKTKHAAVKLTFSNQETYFTDIRHFGTFDIVTDLSLLKVKLDKLGWDPLQEPDKIDNVEFFKAFLNKFKSKPNKTIAETLLDQSLFAGQGNYLKSDNLYLSKIDPRRMKDSLSEEEIKRLCLNLVKLVQESYQAQGGTSATFVDTHGNKGNYQFKAYRRKVDDLGNKVTRIVSPDKRATYFVESIQK
jgi:DNA-formamidopyrimidine glycosylase